MAHRLDEFESHASECVRLANETVDETVQADLLRLRQNYLATADRLRQMGFAIAGSAD